jgi:hypothetical protein
MQKLHNIALILPKGEEMLFYLREQTHPTKFFSNVMGNVTAEISALASGQVPQYS